MDAQRLRLWFCSLLLVSLPASVSVMFACPWCQEAVEILKGRGNASVWRELLREVRN